MLSRQQQQIEKKGALFLFQLGKPVSLCMCGEKLRMCCSCTYTKGNVCVVDIHTQKGAHGDVVVVVDGGGLTATCVVTHVDHFSLTHILYFQ